MTRDLPDDLAVVLDDERLSYAARGVYANAYLRLARDPDAPLSLPALAARTTRDGEIRMQRTVAELVEHGYYTRRRVHDTNGRVAWHFELWRHPDPDTTEPADDAQ